MDGVQRKLGATQDEGFRLAHKPVGSQLERLLAVGSKEGAEGDSRLVDDPELFGKSGVGNNLGIGLQERAQPTDVIPVRVWHDHVTAGQIRDLVQSVQSRSGMCWRGAGVDGDDTVVCTHERKVAEIKSLRDMDPRREL